MWVQYLPPTASLLSCVMLPDSIQSAHHLWSPCEQWHLVLMFLCILHLWCVQPPLPAVHDCVTPFPRRFQTVLWNICLTYFKSGRKGEFHVVLSKVFHELNQDNNMPSNMTANTVVRQSSVFQTSCWYNIAFKHRRWYNIHRLWAWHRDIAVSHSFHVYTRNTIVSYSFQSYNHNIIVGYTFQA